MASFSPAPRRSGRTGSGILTGQSPPFSSSRRSRAGSSRPGSRRATPGSVTGASERLPSIQDDVSMDSVASMDLDQGTPVSSESGSKAENVFAKSDELSVLFYAHLPVEVKQVLRNADFYRDPYSGDIDPITGFALVATDQTCFVWQHAQALSGVPTCYIFQCPPDYTLKTTPLHALVPFVSSREPGLILIASSGEIRFWDSIAIGLAGGEHFNSTQLQLVSGETVTTLTRSDAITYVASTSTGRIFRLTVTSSGGKYHITNHVFSRPPSSLSLSRFLPSLWSGSGIQVESGNISAVALGDKTTLGRDVWALIDTRIQKWSMATEDWEELVLDEDVKEKIRACVRGAFPLSAPSRDSDLDLELLDIAVEKSGKLVVLISYAGMDDDVAIDVGAHPRRIYAIIHVSHLGGFTVNKISGVPYQTTSSSGAPMHARMKLMSGGSLINVQFGDAVALCARDTDYSDRIELKSATDRTLGLAVTEADGELLIMTATTTMKAIVDLEKVKDFDPETGRANLVKSTMTQAILYGSNPENPLNFTFPPEIDEGSLMAGAEQLSQSILESDPDTVRPNVDLGAQMTGRKERLSFLIQFVNENAVLPKMSQRSRQKLATDAEKLYAAHQLWLQHNEFLSSVRTHSVLNEAIYAYMDEVGEGHHEDFMRAFFRLRVADLGRLLSYVMDITRRSSYEMNRKLTEALPEANRVVLTVLMGAINYREYNQLVYGIELPMYNPWTSRPAIIDIVYDLFTTTAQLLDSPMPQVGSSASSVMSEMRLQLCELGTVLFACMSERIDWLRSPVASDEGETEREKRDLEDKFRQFRPGILDTIRRTGNPEHAFGLAEEYHDFRTLASLCHKEKIYPPEENPYTSRIQGYIERFREEFTMELFQWYVENGEVRSLFAKEDAYGGYIDKYFAEHPNPGISWINDMRKGMYGVASQCLLQEAGAASELEVKHLMLSIGKLSQLAQLHEPDASINESVLNAFHDGLDFVSVHESLLGQFKAVLASSQRGKQSLDAQVEIVAKAKAPSLYGRRASLRVFKELVRQLLQGKALGIEDTVDVLTLKDNEGEEVEDYVTALQLLTRAENVPEARRNSAFRSVWRRIYMHDDWSSIKQTVNLTDTQLNDRLRHTALYLTLSLLPPPPDSSPPPSTYTSPTSLPYVLHPAECVGAPSVEEIVSRWPGMAPDEVEALEMECEEEGVLVAGLGVDVGGVWERIRELVMEGEGEDDVFT